MNFSYPNLPSLLVFLLFAIVLGCRVWLSAAQKKLTTEEKFKIFNFYSAQKRYYASLIVLFIFLVIYFFFKDILPASILEKLPENFIPTLFALLIAIMILARLRTVIVNYQKIKKLGLPETYLKTMLTCNIIIYISIALLIISTLLLEKNYFSQNNFLPLSTEKAVSSVQPRMISPGTIFTCPAIKSVTTHLADNNDWQDNAGTWGIVFIYRKAQPGEEVLSLFQAILKNNSLSCFYKFDNPKSDAQIKPWLIVQSQLSGLQKIVPTGYNWDICRDETACKICDARAPESCPVTIAAP